MKLTSPRENPYNDLNKTKDAYAEKGFKDAWTVISATVATLGDQEEQANDLHIAMQQRFISDKNESDNKALYAIASKTGRKGYLEAPYGKFADETTDAFLRNVDVSDSLNNISQ